MATATEPDRTMANRKHGGKPATGRAMGVVKCDAEVVRKLKYLADLEGIAASELLSRLVEGPVDALWEDKVVRGPGGTRKKPEPKA